MRRDIDVMLETLKRADGVERQEYACIFDVYVEKPIEFLYENRRNTEECIEEAMRTKSYSRLSNYWKEKYVLDEMIKAREKTQGRC